MKILIIKASAFGDILHALPIVGSIQSALPGVSIDWVVEEPFMALLSGNPAINRIVVIRTKKWRKRLFDLNTFYEVKNTVCELRREQYDMVIDLQGNLKSGIVTMFTRSQQKVGFARTHLQEKINAFFMHKHVEIPEHIKHITDQYIALVSGALGGPDLPPAGDEPTIFPSENDEIIVNDIVGPYVHTMHKLVAIHQGTTWQTKFWDIESWILMISLLRKAEPQVRVFLTCGSESEVHMAEQTRQAFDANVIIVQKLPIMSLGALYKRMDVVIGGDTGPIHLAAAVGTPTVSLYRSSDGARSGPRGLKHAVIQVSMPCSPCFKTSCPEDAMCRQSLKADIVQARVLERLY